MVGIIVDGEALDLRAHGHFAGEVGGGALFGGKDAVDVEPFENGLMERVDGARKDTLHTELLQQGHGADRSTEVFADGHDYGVDVQERQGREGNAVGGVDYIRRGDIVLYRFHYG